MSGVDLCRGLYGYLAIDALEGNVQPFNAPPTLEPSIDGGVWGAVDGTILATDLDLVRTNRDTGANLDPADGFVEDPTFFDSFNGGGTVELPEGVLGLFSEGEALTIGIRFWINGGGVPADQTGTNAIAKPMQLFGFGGQYAANPTVEVGTRVEITDPTADPFELRVVQLAALPGDGLPLARGGGLEQSLQIRVVGSGGTTQGCVQGVNCPGDSGPEPPDTGGVLAVVMTATREGAYAVCRFYLNGTRIPGDVLLDPAKFARRVTFGDVIESDGVWSHGALWCRALSDDEIATLSMIFDQLETCEGKTPPAMFPLLDDAGNSKIRPGFVVPLRVRSGVIASAGNRRETRLGDEYRPRAYSLEWQHDDGADLAIVLGLIASTGGGSLAVRWRHPQDDEPGTPDTAPRWVIRNLGELESLAVQRNAGGNVVAWRLELEEVL
jgi:hypothetical protein